MLCTCYLLSKNLLIITVSAPSSNHVHKEPKHGEDPTAQTTWSLYLEVH